MTLLLKSFWQHIIIKQVASNKSSLLLKIQKYNTQTLQIFTKIIKTESIYKSNLNSKLEGLGAEILNSIKSGKKRKRFYERVP